MIDDVDPVLMQKVRRDGHAASRSGSCSQWRQLHRGLPAGPDTAGSLGA